MKATHLFMLTIVTALIVGKCAFSEEVRIEKALPAEPPVSVVVVSQCSHAVGVYGTLADGTLLAFDMTSPVSFADVVTWAEKARRAITVETKYVLLPGNMDQTT